MVASASSALATNLAPSLLKLTISSGQASPSPPIGPALGQKGVKAIDFCRQFNDATKIYIPGIPIRTQILVQPDRTFTFKLKGPPTTWMLKNLSSSMLNNSIKKASSKWIVGEVNVRTFYEMVRVKWSSDSELNRLSLRSLFRMMAASAISNGFILYK